MCSAGDAAAKGAPAAAATAAPKAEVKTDEPAAAADTKPVATATADAPDAKTWVGALLPSAADKAEACREQLRMVRRRLAKLPADAADGERDKLVRTVADFEQDLEYLPRPALASTPKTMPEVPTAKSPRSVLADGRVFQGMGRPPTSSDAVKLLTGKGPGTFCIRHSVSSPGSYGLSTGEVSGFCFVCNFPCRESLLAVADVIPVLLQPCDNPHNLAFSRPIAPSYPPDPRCSRTGRPHPALPGAA